VRSETSLPWVRKCLEGGERELSEIKLRLGAVLAVNHEEVEGAVRDFLAMGEEVSRRWAEAPSVLDEFRKSRRHESRF